MVKELLIAGPLVKILGKIQWFLDIKIIYPKIQKYSIYLKK